MTTKRHEGPIQPHHLAAAILLAHEIHEANYNTEVGEYNVPWMMCAEQAVEATLVSDQKHWASLIFLLCHTAHNDGIDWAKRAKLTQCSCKFIAVGEPLDNRGCSYHTALQYKCDVCKALRMEDKCMNYRPSRPKRASNHWPLCVCGHLAQDHN